MPRRGPGKALPHPMAFVDPRTNLALTPASFEDPPRTVERRKRKAAERRANPRTTRRQLLADHRALGFTVTREWARDVLRNQARARRLRALS